MSINFTCFNCRSAAHGDFVGLRECKIHPLKENKVTDGIKYGINRYECCGAFSDNFFFVSRLPLEQNLRKKNRNAKGCLRCDHVRDKTELDAIIKNPYCLVKNNGVEVYSAVKYLNAWEDLEEIFQYVDFNKIKELDLKSLYLSTFSIITKDEETFISNNIYDCEVETRGEKFIRCILVRRRDLGFTK